MDETLSGERARAYHEVVDPHNVEGARLADVILGSQDGLVNVLGVALGVAAVTGDARVVLAAGIATTLAESLSMAAVAYTSRQAERAHFESERARELRHVRRVPQLEQEELRLRFLSRGLAPPLVEELVAALSAAPEAWVTFMLADELRLSPVEPRRARRAAAIVGSSSLLGSLVPLLPFLLAPVRPAIVLSIVLTGAALFALGAYQARVTVGSWLRRGLELTIIGVGAAVIAYAVGRLFRVGPAP